MERYEEYKDSGVEWIGEIPAHWEVMYPKKLFSLSKEKAQPNDEMLTASQKYGIVTQRQFTEIEGQRVVAVITGEDILKHVNVNDFVMSMRSFQGGLEFSAIEGKISSAYVMIHQLRDDLVPHYYKYLFKSASYIQALQSTSNLVRDGQALRFANFVQVYLPMPSKIEQQAIADFLDTKTAEIDSLIEKTERSIELLEEYRKSVISETITKGLDPNVPMKDSGIEWIGEIPAHWELCGLTRYIDRIVDYRGKTPTKVDEGTFLITAKNIKKGKIDYEISREYISPLEFDSVMSRGKLRVGDVLFTTEAPLGEAALVDNEQCAAAQRIIKFECDRSKINGGYFVYWIISNGFQQNLATYATGSTALGIKASKLNQLTMLVPPVEEQSTITDWLDAKTAVIDSEVNMKMRLASLLSEYRKSLISEAVTGKFKVPGVE